MDVTIDDVKDALFNAFEDAYARTAEMINIQENKELWEMIEKHSS